MEVENNLIDSVDNREPVASSQSRFNISDNLSGNLKEMSKWIRRLLILTAIFIGIWVLCLLFILFVIATSLYIAMPETLSFLPGTLVTLSSLSFPMLLLIICLGISVFILLKLWNGQKYIQESLQKQNEDLLYKGASNLMQYWKYTYYMQVVAIVLMFIGFVIGLLIAL